MSLRQRGCKFWEWFKANASKIAESKHDDPVRLALLDELQRVNREFYYEVSVDEVPREFILTVEGKIDLFELVRALVALAPEIVGWRVVALKQPMGFNFTTRYGDVTIDVRRLKFKPLMNRASSPPRFGLRVGIPDFNVDDQLAARNAVLVALDTALGEEVAAREIERIEVMSLPENFEEEGFLPLPDLPLYLNWFKNNVK